MAAQNTLSLIKSLEIKNNRYDNNNTFVYNI